MAGYKLQHLELAVVWPMARSCAGRC